MKIEALEREMRQLEDQNESIAAVTKDLSSKLTGFENVVEMARSKSEADN